MYQYVFTMYQLVYLLSGWSNGKIDARNDRTGEVVFKALITAGKKTIEWCE